MFRATLSDGAPVFILYVGLVFDESAPCVRVFSDEHCTAKSLLIKEALVGTNPPIRSGEWSLVKKGVRVEAPIGPFLDFTMGHEPPFSPPEIWTLVDGKRKKRLGFELPEQYYDLPTTLVQSWVTLKNDLEAGQRSTSGRSVLAWREYSRRHKAGLDPYG
ncbi:MAG TPA: hypothetical protein VK171_15340 [Fimbriimonas sp.]|nr:hypothetical protein [Fimbriimonas sp.]